MLGIHTIRLSWSSTLVQGAWNFFVVKGSWSLKLVALRLKLAAWSLMLVAWCLEPWAPLRNKTITLRAPGHGPSGHFITALTLRVSEGSRWADPYGAVSITDYYSVSSCSPTCTISWIVLHVNDYFCLELVASSAAWSLVLDAWRLMLEACCLGPGPGARSRAPSCTSELMTWSSLLRLRNSL